MGNCVTKPPSWLYAKKDVLILMAGLDGAGKTTILNKLEREYESKHKREESPPPIGFLVGTVEYENTSFTIMDVNGDDKTRDLWKFYYPNTKGLIFVVDSRNKKRVTEAKKLLHIFLNENELKNAALLVFANKKNHPNGMSKREIIDELDLQTIHGRKWHVQPACDNSGDGLREGLDWLSKNINND